MKQESFKELFLKHLSESSLSRVYKLHTQHESGTLSAFRYADNCGEGTPLTKKENRDRNALLKAKLLKLGYGVTLIRGVYVENYNSDQAKEVQEESFIVVDLKDKGTLKEDIATLGKYFEQDSVTYSEKGGEYYIIGTSHCEFAYPSYGQEIKLGTPMFGSDGVFHSKVNGRPFVFAEAPHDEVESLDKHTPTEIRSIDKLSERTLEDLKEETTSADIASVPTVIGLEKRIYPSDKATDKPKKKKKRGLHAHW